MAGGITVDLLEAAIELARSTNPSNTKTYPGRKVSLDAASLLVTLLGKPLSVALVIWLLVERVGALLLRRYNYFLAVVLV